MQFGNKLSKSLTLSSKSEESIFFYYWLKICKNFTRSYCGLFFKLVSRKLLCNYLRDRASLEEFRSNFFRHLGNFSNLGDSNLVLFVIHADLSITDLDSSLQVVDWCTSMVKDIKHLFVWFIFFPLILFSFNFFEDFVVINFITLFTSKHFLSAGYFAFHISLLESRVFVFKNTHTVLT